MGATSNIIDKLSALVRLLEGDIKACIDLNIDIDAKR